MDNEGLRIKDWKSTKRRKGERGEGTRGVENLDLHGQMAILGKMQAREKSWKGGKGASWAQNPDPNGYDRCDRWL